MATTFRWPIVDEFINRNEELTRLESWWRSAERQPVALIGRRRVGKSWLFRRFAHGKPACILVSEKLPPGAQLTRFSEELGKFLGGVAPALTDVASLFRVLYRAARTKKQLFVIDEFPWLLGSSEPEALRTLSAIQAVMEQERDGSKAKIVLCGSQVGQMEALFGEQNPMHGRLIRQDVRPLEFARAADFLSEHPPLVAFERYAITGGMPLYLAKLSPGSVRSTVCSEVLDRDGPLWNEGRSAIEQELREPRVYFAILEALSNGDKELNEIAQPMKIEGSVVSKYLQTLMDLRIVGRHVALGAKPLSRAGHWRLEDPFLRFWFRFVFRFQSGLETGLKPTDLYDSEVAPVLADHVSPVFEDWCRRWLRANRGSVASEVGAWWGNAANSFRKTGERTSEEIDGVGTLRSKVSLVAECKWTTEQLTPQIIADIDTYKVPALKDSGFSLAKQLQIVLFSKSGYSDGLVELASHDPRIELVDVAKELSYAIRE
jgi:AAA+ ATPase superfamily predicted ATPase